MKRTLLLVLIVVAVIAAGVAVFLNTHEQREISVPVAPKDEAWRDRFLAAEKLLTHFGVSSRLVTGLQGNPSLAVHAVLIVPAPRGALSAPTLARLRSAVEQGAHLIMESERFSASDPLFDAFGIKRTEVDAKACDKIQSSGASPLDWRSRSESTGINTWGLTDVEVLGEPSLKIGMHGGENLNSEGAVDWQLKGCDGARVLHRAVGAGRVTALSDITFVTNWAIARDDNAEFFWRLIHQGGEPSEVVFFSAAESGLMAWLLQNAWRVLIAAGVLIALWLWALVPRMGPLRADPEPMRRRLLDHLRANGRLLWSHGARAELAQSARDWALERVAREHPHIRSMTQLELVAFLERRFQLPHAWAVLFALDRALGDVPNFVSLTRACRALHAQLRTPGQQHAPLYDLSE